MASSGKKDNQAAEKVTFRLFPPYPELVSRRAKAAGLGVNAFARLACMTVADSELLDLHGSIRRLEEQLIRLRKEFKDALE